MAKIALLFIAAFCVVQLSLAARVSRESATETTTESLADQINNRLDELKKKAQTYFTKEKTDVAINTISENFKSATNTVGDGAKDFLSFIQGALQNMTDSQKKD
ncbi:uncharacterized protein LOC129570770 [Sitodiplosis mosellana]|uniref:uncharacterized protein LOC129570770 n=1 Tax=Sitodiplosis mosellana TaxID=263140 RepID=UPI0024441C00|nr:uncharacterized protein LOC129570770 [Sitodiplosis mosellana]